MLVNYLKQLARHSAIYGISNILNKALAIFLVPLYVHYLKIYEYGNLDIFFVTLNFLILLFPVGLNSAIFAFTISNEGNDPREVFSNVMNFEFLFAGIFSITLFLFSSNISYLIFNNNQGTYFLKIISADAFFSCLRLTPLARLRVQNKSITYSLLNTLKFLLNLLLNIYLIVIANMGIEGILLAGLYSSILTSFVAIWVIRKDFMLFKISWSLLRKMLTFGIPLVPSSVASAILAMSNRFFLKKISTAEQLGLFALGVKYATTITFLTMAFQTAWPSFLFMIAKRQDAKNIYSKFLTYFLFILFLMFLVLSIPSKELIDLISPSEFHLAYKVVPFIILSHIFYGVYYMTSVGVNIKRKTQYMPFVVGTAAAVNLISNYVLIPPYGMMGAAYASVISYFLLAILSTKLSLHYYRIQYEYVRLIKLVLTTAFLYFLSHFIKIESFLLEIVAKTILILSYPFVLYAINFYHKKEIDNIRKMLRFKKNHLTI